MNIQEIIKQEKDFFNAKENVKKEQGKNKSKILLEFAMPIFEFLKIIQNDKEFLFTSAAHPREEDYSPLFSETNLTLDYYTKSSIKKIKEHQCASILTRNFGYGRSQSKYMNFGITDDFRPYFTFTTDFTPKEEDKIFSVEEAIRTMTKFFLKKRK